jgi:hypothetical protein
VWSVFCEEKEAGVGPLRVLATVAGGRRGRVPSLRSAPSVSEAFRRWEVTEVGFGGESLGAEEALRLSSATGGAFKPLPRGVKLLLGASDFDFLASGGGAGGRGCESCR